MSNKRAILGILIIALGVLFLLNNLGFIDFSVLWGIWNMWPLLLVAIGFNIIFKENQKVIYAIWIVFFALHIFYGIYLQNNSHPSHHQMDMMGENSRVVIEKPQVTEYGQLDLDLGAAELTIEKEDKNLVVAEIRGRDLNFYENYKNNKQEAEISFAGVNFSGMDFRDHGPSNYEFYLNENVLWELDLDLGAISGNINLEDVPVRSIDLDFGAGELDFVLGDKSSELIFHIDAGASSLNIKIPEGAAIKVDMDAALTSTNLDDFDLIRDGDNYISRDYKSADTKIEFDIDMGAGEIIFNQ